MLWGLGVGRSLSCSRAEFHTPCAARAGDGKLGLLVAAVLAVSGHRVTLLGRHEGKMKLVPRLERAVVVDDKTQVCALMWWTLCSPGLSLAPRLCVSRPLHTCWLPHTG